MTITNETRPGAIPPAVAAILGWVVGAAIFFSTTWRTGFAIVSGAGGDTRLVIYLHEHLYRWLTGAASFNSPEFYYPQPNVLGFTDAFILDLAPYAVLRSVGPDPFLSFELMAIGLSALSFACSFVIFRRYLGVRTWIAVAAAMLITFPNNLHFKLDIGHAVFVAFYYVPPICLLAIHGIANAKSSPRLSSLSVATAAALFALLLATSYYMGWLAALTVLIATVWTGITQWSVAWAFVTAHRAAILRLVVAATIGFLIGIIPFATVYGPVLALFPRRAFADYISHAPFLYDAINVSRWNAMWGWLAEAAVGRARAASAEQALAITPGMTLIVLALVQAARRRGAWQKDTALRVGVSAAIAVFVIGWLLTAKIGTFSLFWIPFNLIPGGGAIRAGNRIQLLSNIWLVGALAVMVDRWVRSAPPSADHRRRFAAAAVLLFCLIEQINLLGGALPRRSFLVWLTEVAPPPAQCRAFLIAVGTERSEPQSEAMWISLQVGLPTLNGDSGWRPPGWRLLDPRIDYLDAARAWITQNHLTGVCLYEPEPNRWSPFPPAAGD